MKHCKSAILHIFGLLGLIRASFATYCCPPFYHLTKDNVCQSVEDPALTENIQEDLKNQCESRLVQISSSLVSFTNNEGKSSWFGLETKQTVLPFQISFTIRQ